MSKFRLSGRATIAAVAAIMIAGGLVWPGNSYGASNDAATRSAKGATTAATKVAASQISFQEDVLPILKGWCQSCHQPGGIGFKKSGLNLMTYKGLMKGTKYGPMIVPGDPQASNLMWLLDWRASPKLRMPFHRKQLSVCARDTIRKWIRQGAKDD